MSANKVDEPNVVKDEGDANEYEHKREKDKQASSLRFERVQLLNQFFARDGVGLMAQFACRLEV